MLQRFFIVFLLNLMLLPIKATPQELESRVQSLLKKSQIDFDAFWIYATDPSIPHNKKILAGVENSIRDTFHPSEHKRLDKDPRPLKPTLKGDEYIKLFKNIYADNLLELKEPLKDAVYHSLFRAYLDNLTTLNEHLSKWFELIEKIDRRTFLITAVYLDSYNCGRLRNNPFKQLSCTACSFGEKPIHCLTFGAENNLQLQAYVQNEWLRKFPNALTKGQNDCMNLLKDLERLHTVVLLDACQQSRRPNEVTEAPCNMSALIYAKNKLETFQKTLGDVQEYHAYLFTEAGLSKRNAAFKKKYAGLFQW